MLKKIIVLISFIVYMSSTLQAIDILSKDLEIERIKAVKFYKEKDYESAYKILSILYMSSLSDTNINFMLGRSAYEIGKYKIALASFERVKMLDSTNVRNQLEIARTQYMLELYEDSKLSFKQVLAYPSLPDNVRTNIELFLSKISNKLQKSFFFLNFSAGIIYDSNVNYGALDDTYNLPNYGKFFTVGSESDMAYELQADLTNIYDIGDKNGFSIRNMVSVFNRTYDTQSTYDITYLSYSPALVYKDMNNVYELNLMFDNMRLDNENYLDIFSVMSNVIHKLDSTTRLIINVKYANKKYKRKLENGRDADNYEFSLSYQKLWSSSYFTVRGIGEYERKDSGNRNDINYNKYRLLIDYTKQFYPTYIARVDLEVNTKEYQDESLLFQNTREDNGYRSGLILTKKFSSSFYIDAKFLYERFWSNQSVYEYDKQTYGLTLHKSF